MECNIQSLMAGVMMAAQLGLRIDPTLGQAYLVPYGKEAQFILGYRGMLALIRNSGEVSNIMAHPVYDNDLFILQYGLDEKLEHIPWHCRMDKNSMDGGNFKGAYVVAKLKDGGNAHLYMPKAEIDDHRKRSKASNSGPWVTDYVAMALKTVVRGISKWLPMSIDDYRKIAANDETVKTELAPDMTDVTDLTADVQPVNVGQIEEVTGEIPMTDEEKEGLTSEMLQDIYRLLDELSKIRAESPDDIIDTLTNKKIGCQQELEDKSSAYLNDIRLMLANVLAKES
jgi:recombination protein RecT